MSYQAIREALATRLNAIGSVGPVHAFERYLIEQAEVAAFQAEFAQSSALNTWMIDRKAVADRPSAADDGTLRRHTMRMEGFYALKDSSQSKLTFHDIIEDVCDALVSGDRTLGNVCLTCSLPAVETIEETLFAGVLCHRAEIQVVVEEVLGTVTYRSIDAVLHASAQVAGTGSEVKGAWVAVGEFLSGLLFIDVTAIEAATTAAFTVDFANEDKAIVGASGVTVSNMTSVSQQMVAFATVPAYMRLNHTVSNGKNVTYRAVFSGKGLY